MWWWLLACAGSEPVGLQIGPVALPVATNATRVPFEEYAAFSDPLHVPSERDLQRCLAGEPVDHAWAVLELTDGDPRLSGRVIAMGELEEALLTMTDATQAVAKAGCGRAGPRLLVVANESAPFDGLWDVLLLASRCGFSGLDLLVDDPSPAEAAPMDPGRPENVLLGPGGPWLLGERRGAVDLAAELGPGAVDLTLVASDGVPLREVVAAHDLAAGLGGRVVWGIGAMTSGGPSEEAEVPIAPIAQASPMAPAVERRLSGDVAVLRTWSPREGDGFALPPRIDE